MASHEYITRENEARFIEDWLNAIIVLDNYNAHRDEFLQALSEFKDMSNE